MATVYLRSQLKLGQRDKGKQLVTSLNNLIFQAVMRPWTHQSKGSTCLWLTHALKRKRPLTADAQTTQVKTSRAENFFFFSFPVSADLWCPPHFRVPLTCYTCITALCCRRVSCSAGAPAAFLLCHDGGAHNVRSNMPVLAFCHRGQLFQKTLGDGRRAAYFLRVEGAGGGGGGHRRVDLPRRRDHHHHRHRVRDLLRGRRGVRGAWVRAGLVLWDRAETHLLPLRHRGLLPRTHRDPSGRQSNRSQGECSYTCCVRIYHLSSVLTRLWQYAGVSF